MLKQAGDVVTGDQHGEIYNTTMSGWVHANDIALNSVLPVVGYLLPCHFTGKVDGDRMSGKVTLAEYGVAAWEAIRG